MQFYLNGYKTGDPFIEDPHPSVAERPGGLPDDADVVIIGCGPAGLVLAAQMANFPDIRTVVIDRKDGPLEVGQADGVACRNHQLGLIQRSWILESTLVFCRSFGGVCGESCCVADVFEGCLVCVGSCVQWWCGGVVGEVRQACRQDSVVHSRVKIAVYRPWSVMVSLLTEDDPEFSTLFRQILVDHRASW